MTSRLDALVADLYAAFGGTASGVIFETGRLRLAENGPRGRVIFVRQRGTLFPAVGPDRQILGTPIDDATPWALQRFQRSELLEVTMRAADETALDALFDRVVNLLFTELGPNAFEANGSEYVWFDEDSSAGAAWTARQPAIRLYVRARLRAVPEPVALAVIVEEIDTAAGFTEAGATAPDVVSFITPTD